MTGAVATTVKAAVIDKCLASMESRFQDTDSGVLNATTITNLRKWPLPSEKDEIEGFVPTDE